MSCSFPLITLFLLLLQIFWPRIFPPNLTHHRNLPCLTLLTLPSVAAVDHDHLWSSDRKLRLLTIMVLVIKVSPFPVATSALPSLAKLTLGIMLLQATLLFPFWLQITQSIMFLPQGCSDRRRLFCPFSVLTDHLLDNMLLSLALLLCHQLLSPLLLLYPLPILPLLLYMLFL